MMMKRRAEGSFFFFSSRRRHTRYWRDWSSDVCSSDLVGGEGGQRPEVDGRGNFRIGSRRPGFGGHEMSAATAAAVIADRSEERRVGKECRSRWSPYH